MLVRFLDKNLTSLCEIHSKVLLIFIFYSAVGTVLLRFSKDKIERNANVLNDSLLTCLNANVFDDLIFACLEINKNVFEGFIDAMKMHLKKKMFAKIFRVDDCPNSLNMVSIKICPYQKSLRMKKTKFGYFLPFVDFFYNRTKLFLHTSVQSHQKR